MARDDPPQASSWVRAQALLVGGILAPLIVLVPLRALLAPDTDLVTVAILGPATEESLKLAGTLVVAILGAVLAGPAGGPRTLRQRFFLAPWLVGGGYGAYEGLTLYAGESSLVLLVRMWAHAGTVALGLAACLAYWRLGVRPSAGALAAWLLATVVHILFNAFAFLPGVDYPAQALYSAALFVVALVALLRVVSQEPSSVAAARFLSPAGTRVRA